MQKDDDKMIKLEFICEELNEQLKLILELISRYKQKSPHLKEKIQCEKTIERPTKNERPSASVTVLPKMTVHQRP